MSIATFIYKLNKLGFSIWLENEKIKYRQYKECSNSPEIINEIINNKDILIEFLSVNNCYNDNYLRPQYIYMSNNNKGLLSFAQERLWFIEKYEGGTNAYNIPLLFKLSDGSRLEILEESIRAIVSRHEILRTVIREDEEGNGYQLVLDDKEYPLEIRKIVVTSCLELDQEMSREVNHVYDLGKEYPIKVSFYELADSLGGECYLSIVIHHIAFDGWSVDILLKEIQEYYRYFLDKSEGLGGNLNLPRLGIQYKDFALWQKSYLKGEILEEQLNYWKRKLDGYETLNLISDKPRPNQINYSGKNIYFDLDEYTSIALRKLAEELNVSLYSLLLSGYYLMLKCYSNQEDIVVGSPVANRHYSEVEHLIGFFINSLALRMHIDSNFLIKNFIQNVGESVVDAQLHQDLPFEKLVEELEIEKDTSRHPIFQVMFGVDGVGNDVRHQDKQQAETDFNNLLKSYTPESNLYTIARFDIIALIDYSQTQLRGRFNYVVSLYSEETIARFIDTYTEILKQIATLAEDKERQENIRIRDLKYLSTDKYNKIIKAWNETDRDYPNDKTVHALFEEQVEINPDSIAVVYKEVRLTYRELNRRANQLANYLREVYNIQPDMMVALCLDKSEHMLIAILGILKAGGGYVPINPDTPIKQLKFILEDTNTSIILTDNATNNKIPATFAQVISLNECVETFSQNSSDNLLHVNSQNSIAYVIYTSGTTGNPKGVVSQHQGIVNYIYNIKNYIQISSDDKIDFSTNIGFDLTVTTTICGLCLGAQIVIYPDRLEDLELYKEHLIKNDINFIKLVPSYFELLVDALPSTKVSRVILGGEKVNSSITHKLSNLYNTDLSITIYDEYGPTETTVGASHSQIYLKNNSTIGKLYYNYKGYVLDSNLTPLPIGAVGELYIGGVGLARGYLNRPDLTAEKFIADPFQTEDEKADKRYGTNGRNARLYKTGDLVRWLPDGNLEYIGRNDFQVKLRGYRIELGEVEAKLKMYEAVKDAVVLVKNDRLVAYITPNKFRSVPVSNILKIIKNSNTEHKLIDLPNGLEVFYINKQETSLLYDEIFKCNDYVADKINIKDGDTIIDIGANIGMFSISIGIYYQNIKIYAFEPILPIFEVLKKNIEIYELNTECFNYGVGNKNSIEKFTYYPNSSVLSGKYADLEEEKINVKQYLMNQLINETISFSIEELIEERLKQESLECQVITLSSFIKQHKIFKIDLLKIDAEKSELDILEGIDNEDWIKIEQIVVEVHDNFDRLNYISNLLKEKDYFIDCQQPQELQNTNLFIIYAHRNKGATNVDLPGMLKKYKWSARRYLIQSVKDTMKQTLLPFMVPDDFILLDQIPLTVNGKLDRKALPEPELIGSDNYIAPKDAFERRLCEIWGEILKLPADKVGITDDFFRLGGNSIIAIRLVSKIKKELNNNISVSSIFKYSTIEKLVQCLEFNSNNLVAIEKAIVKSPEEQLLSFAQERLWFIEKYEGGTNAYNIPLLFKLSDGSRLEILEESIRAIVSRHEILRTVIREDEEGNGYQLVLDDKEYPLEIRKIVVTSCLELDQEMSREVNHVYDLGKEYPIKVSFYELADSLGGECYLSIVIHHIAFDGWSVDILLKEIQEYYRYFLDKSEGLGGNLNLPRLGIQYKDFALWQKSYLKGEILEEQLNYWKRKLDGYETLNLISDKPRPNQINYEGKDIYFELEVGTSIALRKLAKELNVSLYSLLLSGYYLMLKCYSNQEDIVVGSPVANRHYSEVEHLIGFFINSLALKMHIDSNFLIKNFIQNVGESVVDAQLHQDLPFEKLVEELEIEKDTSRHPIFQVMFGVQGFGVGNEEMITRNSQLLNVYRPEVNLYNIAKFDISTFINDSQTQLRGSFNYAVSVYNQETIVRLIETYTEILKQIATLAEDKERQENIRIRDLKYLSTDRYNEIIKAWNETDVDYPNDKTIHKLFEEQVEKTPDSIAVVCERFGLTYRELNRRANQLASYLREVCKIRPDMLVILCLDRTEHMLIGIIGVLKAGGAYVPMDPSYPDERIGYILEDTAAKVVLTNARHKERLGSISSTVQNSCSKILAIDSVEAEEKLRLQPSINLHNTITNTNLAYAIYTSGTTGNPKGTILPHKGIYNLFNWYINTYKFTTADKVLIISSFSFDLTQKNLLGILLIGGQVHLLSSCYDVVEIRNTINRQGISMLNCAPSAFYPLLEDAMYNIYLRSLRYAFLGGEPIIISKLKKTLAPNLSCQIVNTYGPTECSDITTAYFITKNDIINNLVSPIGSIISNARCYTLDSNLTPLPIGAVGELYIGGVGLARGYLNRPDLTAEKFIANPFQTEYEKADKMCGTNGSNARLYKTGDLVRWLPDGNLEYIGRNDFQVKLRGYRIELGEIERILLDYEGIEHSIVLVKGNINATDQMNIDNLLVGYYVSANKIKEDDILTYLQSRLPEYMIPRILIHLECLPLTINGKLDRKALPEPKIGNIDNYVAPKNELEQRLCEIWAEAIGISIDKVGTSDNFFKLGGNSIIAIKLVSKINSRLSNSINVTAIFQYNTINKLACYLNIIQENYKSSYLVEGEL